MSRTEASNRVQDTGAKHAINLAEILLQGTARILDIQAAGTRTLLQYQAKGAAMFGAPDWSELFKRSNGRFFETTAEQALNYMRQTSEAISAIQTDMVHLIEEQTEELGEQIQQGLKEAGERIQEGIEEGRRMTQEATKETRRGLREAEEAVEQGPEEQASEKGAKS
ncbi:MAG TPA: phasin family protein, partial [Gammaproteobacteria bacterium]|nr:phasin family protein [Gammaproteobacteria bacterium]